ncbi:chemotaxis protein CheA [Planctobacterium marinum]|uniref:Chemotaxis protein CheA n=1 Tax=Planctobacterium marinum TaxID=1631968 RepID=A0AA48KUA7_9ALTE|nr:chemotaxis protein CheA [Planctobacterium marinum]
MSDPLAQFRAVFFDESAEAIDAIERNLLDVDDASEMDSETINDIFRSAHSLKGGSATFGMGSLTDFTHVMETLLDKVRAGQLSLSQDILDCLFSSLDVLRNLVAHYQFDDEINQSSMQEVKAELERLLVPGATSAGTSEITSESVEVASSSGSEWLIEFAPDPAIMMTGNDPLRYIDELTEFGEIDVTCQTSAIPPFEELEPTHIYCTWKINLKSEKPLTEEELKDVFLWIEDEAEFKFTPLSSASSAEAETPVEISEPVATAPEPAAVAPAVTAAPAEAAPAPASGGDKSAAKAKRGSQSIRVDLEKIDSLINLLGELVITQSMLSIYGDEEKYPQFERLSEGLSQLERHTRDLQEGVMRIRMLPIDFCFSRFPRMVRDLAKKLNKSIAVEIIGEHTEVDKTVIEELNDPLVHLVRNSVDHGLEDRETRLANGKSETGTVTLKAFHQVGNIIIEISDDGAGLNTERIKAKAIEKGVIKANANLTEQAIHELIFAPGFSTADAVTDLSGRGVGMDVVKRNIRSLGGTIDVRSIANEGTTFTIRLPLTLAILDGQLLKVGEETYIIPMLSIIESIQLKQADINKVGKRDVSFKWRGNFIPILNLAEMFDCPVDQDKLIESGLVVVVESDNKHCGILVSELNNHQQVVVKSLEANYAKIEGLSGATILGDGSVALIIDVGALISRVRMH